jgi:hypothetical protein
MMAATLTIENLSNEIDLLGDNTWSHPVYMNVLTHVQDENGNWKINPDYEGSFEVIVSCDNLCQCITNSSLSISKNP